MMYKIAVLGDRDSIYGFAALGLATFPVSDPEKGAHLLRELSEQNYAVIYITESLACQIQPEIDYLRTQPLPAVILIPGISGNTGDGIRAVKRSVEQAVGSDIIFNND